VEIEHPKAGRVKLTGPHIRLSESRAEIRTPPPLLGQHNGEIFGGWLGLSAGELEELKEEGLL
jgi:formyl-CoA transferase